MRKIGLHLLPRPGLDPRSAACLFASFLTSVCTSQAAPPAATLSYPPNNALVRANVPVFGTAFVPNDPAGLQNWRLEYGPGRDPKEWTLIKESTEALPEDPWATGRVTFNPNDGAHGNITDWSVGLTGYSYANWRNNLNGIYTLRLTATGKNGEKTEITRLVTVGEAIVRTQGGTAHSTDLKCHILFQPFSFGGFMSMVVAIVRQIGPDDRDAAPTEEVGPAAEKIYAGIPSELRRLSSIYRVYPNGMILDPPATIQLECFSPPASSTGSKALLYLWNPVAGAWEPLKTEWHDKVGMAKANLFPPYETYVAAFARTQPLGKPSVAWGARTAVDGAWEGRTEPFAEISVSNPPAHGRADENGLFAIPFLLRPGDNIYHFEVTPRSGENFRTATDVIQQTETVSAPSPTLSLSGPPEIYPHNHLYLLCEDLSLPESAKFQRRSILATIQDSLQQQSQVIELLETVPNSGHFACSLDPGDPRNPFARVLAAYPHHARLTISVKMASVEVTALDQTKPSLLALDSSTHPCGLYLTNDQLAAKLQTSTLHDAAKIERQEDGVLISGVSDTPSARMVYWPIEGFSPETWPLIGFTYKLNQPSRWQLLVSSDNGIRAFSFGNPNPWFDPYSATDPLMADGKWHRWQGSLFPSPFPSINRICFGSWVKGAYLVADPTFHHALEDTLRVRDLWIGKGYSDRQAEMHWQFEDASPLRFIRWWIDPVSDGSKFPDDDMVPKGTFLNPTSLTGSCRFTIPIAGQWFFHVQAQDIAGNTSIPASFPIHIIGQSIEQNLIQRYMGKGPGKSTVLRWEQPNGLLQLKLPGAGPVLDAKSVVLIVNGAKYSCPEGRWNASSETLSIYSNSFATTAPMGLNGETLQIALSARDLKGHPLEGLPSFSVKVASPFTFDQTKTPYRLDIASAAVTHPWSAFWKNSQSPWSDAFPSQANNSLVVVDSSSFRQDRDLVQWERPIKPLQDSSIYFLERFGDFAQKPATPEELVGLPVFQCDAYPVDPDNSQIPWNSAWGIKIFSSDFPRVNFARLAIKNVQHNNTINLKVVAAAQLAPVVDSQQKGQEMRIDAWLPPGRGQIGFAFPPDRQIQIATTDDPTFRLVPGNSVSLAPSASWTKFAIVISTPKNFRGLHGTRVDGTYAW